MTKVLLLLASSTSLNQIELRRRGKLEGNSAGLSFSVSAKMN